MTNQKSYGRPPAFQALEDLRAGMESLWSGQIQNWQRFWQRLEDGWRYESRLVAAAPKRRRYHTDRHVSPRSGRHRKTPEQRGRPPFQCSGGRLFRLSRLVGRYAGGGPVEVEDDFRSARRRRAFANQFEPGVGVEEWRRPVAIPDARVVSRPSESGADRGCFRRVSVIGPAWRVTAG